MEEAKMRRPKVSVIFATYNRRELLERTLVTLLHQTERDFEVIAISDDCSDGTYELLREWQKKLDIKIITLKKSGQWRDCSSIINLGISMSRGRVCLLTQPEVMLGRDVIRLAAETPDWEYRNFKPYFFHPTWQSVIDDYDWVNKGLLELRKIPTFYKLVELGDTTKDDKYIPNNLEKDTLWHSWTTSALTRKTLFDIGGMQEYELWGTVDMDFMARRELLGIKNNTMLSDDSYCVHQYHTSPRCLKDSKAILVKYNTKEDCILNNL
jgi:hypothetical protein